MRDAPVHPAAIPAQQLLAECREQRTRRSGPGGQHRNKVETGVVLVHQPTGARAEATERRSQAQNRRVALSRLRVTLAIDARCEAASPYVPSALWRERCRNGRIIVSRNHEDFPAVLAEALDVIVANNYDVKAAAEALDCSSSQLIRLLRLEPLALAAVNRSRAQVDLHPLK